MAGVDRTPQIHVSRPADPEPFPQAMAGSWSRARPTCTTPANGATTAASRIRAWAAARVGRRGNRDLCRDRGAAEFAGLHATAAGKPQRRRSVLFRHALPRTAYAGRIRAARHDQGLQRGRMARAYRLDLLMKGDIDATTLTETLHHARGKRKGCRIVCSAFYHGTEVASDKVDAETYAAFNRAVRAGGCPHQCEQARISAVFHRLPQSQGPGDRHVGPSPICASHGWWWSTPRPFPRTRCSAPIPGSRAGTCCRKTASPLELINLKVAGPRATSRLEEPHAGKLSLARTHRGA